MINYYETKSQPIARVMVWQAYKEVKSNAGSGGIDKMSWDYLQKNASTELYMLWNRLSSGSYFSQAVKQVAISKKRRRSPLFRNSNNLGQNSATSSSKTLRTESRTDFSQQFLWLPTKSELSSSCFPSQCKFI